MRPPMIDRVGSSWPPQGSPCWMCTAPVGLLTTSGLNTTAFAIGADSTTAVTAPATRSIRVVFIMFSLALLLDPHSRHVHEARRALAERRVNLQRVMECPRVRIKLGLRAGEAGRAGRWQPCEEDIRGAGAVVAVRDVNPKLLASLVVCRVREQDVREG